MENTVSTRPSNGDSSQQEQTSIIKQVVERCEAAEAAITMIQGALGELQANLRGLSTLNEEQAHEIQKLEQQNY
jgi:hypothetical protein